MSHFKSIAVFLGALVLLQTVLVEEGLASPVNPDTRSAAYLDLAKSQIGDEHQGLMIQAAERLLHEGHWQEGQRILSQLTALSSPLFDQKQLLLAQIDMMRKEPQAALVSLSLVKKTKGLSPSDTIQYQKLLAKAYQSVRHEVMHGWTAPRNMALLLPVTGPLAGPGLAIQDGFMAGVHELPMAERVSVRLYNTDNANIEALYQQVIADGADYVVGPLSKVQVDIVAQMTHPVPTLLLNESDVPLQAMSYQLGLSPAKEARQVAIKAHSDGLSHALIIAPSGDWGHEIVHAFSEVWGARGGVVVDTLPYNAKGDMTYAVSDFLGVTDSERRGKELKQLLGQHIETTVSRRQDFDVIFLVAYPSNARQIMPLLRYYFAGDVPVYATSVAYAGVADPMKDKDLNGLIFCDMPWVFTHQMGHKNWPEPLNSYTRLYALGKESFALSSQWNHLLLFPSVGVAEHPGALYLSAAQHIRRRLAWGQFKQGLASKLTS